MLNLDRNKKYLLACSFGPDSMALFNMLLEEGFSFSAALVNYNLREESKKEKQDFISYCKSNNISYYIREVNNAEYKGNLEECCRNIRYAFFSEIISKNHINSLLVAHHKDDLIETFLMQQKRKNLVQYYGIAPVTKIKGIEVIRPLLKFTKKELLDYCKNNNVPYSIDSSNLTDKYLRNRIRHSIIEKMTDDDKTKMIREIEEKNYLLVAMQNQLDLLDLSKIDTLLTIDNQSIYYALNKLLNDCGFELRLSKLNCDCILKIVYSQKPYIKGFVKKGLYFIKDYGECYFSDITSHQNYKYIIKCPTKVDNEHFYLDFTGDTNNRNVSHNDYPLTIRIAKPNDLYEIKDYSVNVRRLFIDWKMPHKLRDRWPVILNKFGKIIYIPRYQKDFKPSKNDNFYVK